MLRRGGPTRSRWWRDARAAIGVGQVFGIVGTVAALGMGGAVLANTDFFESRIQRTTLDSVEGLSLGLGFGGVMGFVNQTESGPKVDRLHLNVRVADGVEQVDLQQVAIRATDGTELVVLRFDNGSLPSGTPAFRAKGVLDDDGSVATGRIDRADVADLVLDLEPVGLGLGPRESITLMFQAGTGPTMRLEAHAPASLGADRIVSLERDVRRGE